MKNALRLLLHVAITSLVMFELSLKFFEPDCLTCLFNISDIKIPIMWTESPPTKLSVREADGSASEREVEPDLGSLSGEERADLARTRCTEVYGPHPKLENLQYPFENRVFLANNEKLAYCAVAKAFSSNIKRVMMFLSRPGRNLKKLKTDISPIKKIVYPHQLNFWPNSTILKHYSDSGQTQVLQDYYKVVVVRDPILKAISAYRDKFFSKTDDKFHKFFRQATGKAICVAMAKYREREDANKYLKSAIVDCGRNPAYMDLQAFLVWSFLVPDQFRPHATDNLNPHWAPSIPICRICDPTVNYNFIGHFESGLRDIYAIFDRAKWDFPFPSISDTSISEEEAAAFKKEVASLPEELVRELNQAMVAERYILGYTNEKPLINR